MIDPRPFFDGPNEFKTLKRQMTAENFQACSIKGKSQRNLFNNGHLAAKSDFVYRTEQQATFFYGNTAPQWSVLNIGNFAILEEEIRNLAKGRGPLTVYSGKENHLIINVSN